MTAVATTCPVFTADQWAERLLTLFPEKWSSDQARITGAALYAAFQALGSQYTFLQEQFLYAFNASRIATAQDEALDRVAADFFGATAFWPATVVRVAGESDDSFRSRIIANIFIGGGSRAAITRVFLLLTGKGPRIIEPFSTVDCACLDTISYADIDTLENPSRIADTGLRGALIVESELPSFGGQGNNPVYGLDDGLAADFSYCIDAQPSWFQGVYQMDQLLRKVKTLGTKAWRKWMQVPAVTYPIGNTIYVQPGKQSYVVDLFPAFAGPYMILAQPSWNTTVSYKALTNSSFEINFSTPPTVNSPVDWMGVPLSVPGFGILTVKPDDRTSSIAIPSSLKNARAIAMANWDGVAYIDALASNEADFAFSTTPSELSLLSYGLFDLTRSGVVDVDVDSLSVPVALPSGIPAPLQVFVMPTWNTNCAVTKGVDYFNVDFNVPAPSGSKLYWGIYAPAWHPA